ncbi:MAG: trypsin-like peptidase domain-containing protein [Clostridia bacterium]|nr:trypsin-like peptidase domain-containing protein [Clostridia bacterium]
MDEYNFDPMTGEPIQKEEPSKEAATPQEEPVQEETTYHYVRPEFGQTAFNTSESEQPQTPFEQPQAPSEPPQYNYYTEPQKPKKESKPVTMKVFIPVVAVVAVFALILGAAGGFLASALRGGTPLAAGGTAVIYKTTKLKDADGGNAKKALTVPEVATLVKNSVVEITTEQIVTGSFMQQYVSEGAGSGVIITADGYIVTNHHVIDGATNINVRLADGTEYAAKLIGSDAKSDLAVIKVEATELTPAAYGKSAELAVGETVVAVGNPLGKLGGTVTQGIISALDREITIENTTMRLLQTDTAINPGNSGGGMFNTSGQLVGVINAKSAGAEIEGLGFAIPIDTAATVIEDLLKVGYVTGRVDPGFTFVEVNDAMTAMMYRVSEMGLYISAVATDSDAAKAGFQSGDYVVSVEGTKVKTEAEANAVIDGKKVGDTLTMVIKRNGTEQTVTCTLSEYVPSAEKNNQFQTKPQQQQTPNLPSIGDFFGF